jgi:hypothetical protein
MPSDGAGVDAAAPRHAQAATGLRQLGQVRPCSVL